MAATACFQKSCCRGAWSTSAGNLELKQDRPRAPTTLYAQDMTPSRPSRSQNAILKTNQGSALCRIVAPQRSLLHRPVELMPACGGKYSGSGALTTSPSASSPIICWWQQQPHHRQHQRLHHNHAQTTRTTSGLPAAVRTHALANAALRPSQCGATNPWLRAEDLQA